MACWGAFRRARTMLCALVLCGLLSPSAGAQSDAWPSRPIRMIVVFPAGGGTDTYARLLQPALQEILGQSIVIENRGGGGGLVGTEAIVNAPPDGYTFGWVISSYAASPALVKDLKFDPIAGITPVSLVARSGYIVVVQTASDYRSMADLIAAARAKPGTLSYATSGIGTGQHIFTEILKRRLGIDLIHVPYRGGAPANAAVAAGETTTILGNFPSMLPLVTGGRVRPLAVTYLARSPQLPDVPTVAETVLPDYDAVEWFGVIGPAGVPPAIVARLSAALAAAAKRPEMVQRFAELGSEVVGSDPPAFGTRIRDDIARIGAVIREANIKIDD
jgi:tripartite-type tricarboxylate transporter receptor subunit TctC